MTNREEIDRAIERISYKLKDTCHYCYEDKSRCKDCSEKKFYDLLIDALQNYEHYQNCECKMKENK